MAVPLFCVEQRLLGVRSTLRLILLAVVRFIV